MCKAKGGAEALRFVPLNKKSEGEKGIERGEEWKKARLLLMSSCVNINEH